MMRYRSRCVGIGQGPVFSVRNESGQARTTDVAGFPVVATENAFLLDLGVNGRRCGTWHQPENNMTVSATGIQGRFEVTGGTDPIFRTNDGSNSPLADVSTVDARRIAYSMLLAKGVIVNDPYGYAGSHPADRLDAFCVETEAGG